MYLRAVIIFLTWSVIPAFGDKLKHKEKQFNELIKEIQHLGESYEEAQNKIRALENKLTSIYEGVSIEKVERKQNSQFIRNLQLDVINYRNVCREEIAGLSEIITDHNNDALTDIVNDLEARIRKLELKSPNLALRKPATESSTLPNKYQRGPGSATDGNKDGDFGHASCTHTKFELNPWWRVDLQFEYYIDRVVITNREDCCGERLHNLVVTVSMNANDDGQLCGRYQGPSTNGATVTINCEPDVYGRYVKIMIEDTEYLSLCEVEIH